ncbi:hypothetical protein [Paenibacillus nasutitermitis]|uniref:hypothetical protein n=1 Tax=Paenibacillus nasutitermitis TaxID=1652958 RepID=UPI001669AA2F|nr:hypothetical protein [Paenibacillus nasutitermitis]
MNHYMSGAAAALLVFVCASCDTIKVSPVMNRQHGYGNFESISTNVYPPSRSVLREVYGLKRMPEPYKPALPDEEHVGRQNDVALP